MRCPFCRNEIQLSGRHCPRCGRDLFVLSSSGQPGGQGPQRAAAEAPAGGAGNALPAPPDAVGKTCPYDQYPIASGDQVVVCPACGVPHHADCWTENGGCTTYACAQGPAYQAAAQPQAAPPGYQPAPGPGWQPPYPPPQSTLGALAAELDQKATNALICAVVGLFCCGVPSVVGFFLAVSVLSNAAKTRVVGASARAKAAGAVVIAVVAVTFWALVAILTSLESGY